MRGTLTKPLALIHGGETTVSVTGTGLGGRNQELALAAAIALDGIDGITIASIGTDGIDGPTDAAGAAAEVRSTGAEDQQYRPSPHGGLRCVRAGTGGLPWARGLDARAALRDNDSYRFWTGLGDIVTIGRTGTNVMDLVIVTITPPVT